MLLPVYPSPGKGGMPFLFTWYYLVLLWLGTLKPSKGRAITGPPQVLLVGCHKYNSRLGHWVLARVIGALQLRLQAANNARPRARLLRLAVFGRPKFSSLARGAYGVPVLGGRQAIAARCTHGAGLPW